MTQHRDSAVAEPRTASVDVPLSDRPLVADDENTVISSPERRTTETPPEAAQPSDAIRQRLFPTSGASHGEESGIRLAHFEIRERLGSGGMGAVFRATDLELARDVALKILHPASSHDSSLVARFRNEGRACAHLNHDNIARVFYAGTQDGLHFIAYELADGKTIKDLIQQYGQLTPEETVNYAIQVTLALNHIAAAGIVHRDIKPSNIMLTESGRVKVVDLGLARRDVTDSIGDITVAGTTLGTFDYIAPEQARDPRNADIRSDIYSLGCTMYHMLTGQPPYPEGTALQKLLDHQGKSPPNPRSINAAISPELAAVMRKMMANNPDHRYQVPALLLSDLLHIAQLMGLQSVPAEGIIWRKRDPLAARPPLGAVWVFASVLVICVTALLLSRFPGNAPAPLAESNADEFIGLPITPERFSEAPLNVNGQPAAGAGTATAAAGTATNTGAASGQSAPGTETAAAAGAAAVANTMAVPIPVPAATFGGLSPALVQISLPVSGSPAAVSAAPRTDQGPFILQTEAGNRLSFRTLQGAVADARSGDVILLRYNGYPADILSQPPVRIVGMNLIIRAAEGFRPTLEFDGASSGSLSRTDMFTLRRGTLTIRDLDLRMVTREDVSTERWSMFRLDGPSHIQLENVTLDCRNPSQQPASLFDLPEGGSTAEDGSSTETTVSLHKVVCRGEADGFRIASQPQGRIRIQNSAFALSGAMLEDLGSSSMLQTRGNLELWMEHASLILAGPLLHMRDSDELTGRGAQRVLPNLTVRSEACVMASALPNGRLIFAEGNSFIEDIESALTWNGFTNLYSRFGVMWQIDTAALDYTGRRLDLTQWKQFWQNRTDGEENTPVELSDSSWVDAAWMSASTFQPGRVTSGSFQLNGAAFQAGGGSLPLARDGLIPGVAVGELPAFPLPLAAPTAEAVPSLAASRTDSVDDPATDTAARSSMPPADSSSGGMPQPDRSVMPQPQ